MACNADVAMCAMWKLRSMPWGSCVAFHARQRKIVACNKNGAWRNVNVACRATQKLQDVLPESGRMRYLKVA